MGKLNDDVREVTDEQVVCNVETVSMLEDLLNSSLVECGGTLGVNVPLWNWLRAQILLRNIEMEF